ncbi:hypothetical protein J5X84_02805 [Streptosporangiaceae bacterium NEAU-GS5]|nr:hypothetical protein [Streptosporangiaceae bacterium NEAU-GS5]
MSPDEIVKWLTDRPPKAGATRILAIEGRSGSGKSTLGQAVAAALGAPLIRMDDLYAGWDGLLPGIEALVSQVLEPLAKGRDAHYRRYDWRLDRHAEWVDVPAALDLVIEGVGAGARQAMPYLAGLIWTEAPDVLRRERALARDGGIYQSNWDRWARHEDSYYAADNVRSRADLIMET